MLPEVFKTAIMSESDIWRNDVTFERNHTYLIEAESGKGKSTFCSYIMGYRNDYEGELLFDDVNIRCYRKKDWVMFRTRAISHLFQELRLFPELTAFENVEIKNKLTKHKTKEEILTWFEELGIPDKVNTRISRMSFGQQQRVAMMRALAQPFQFLLVDEPISHLDDDNSRVMGSLMQREVQKQGAGLIVTSIGKHFDLEYDNILKL